eukprot:c39225_g1_i1.p1 GENE.c39225_g1_i1~~c39225_g1_i1.p1  ORF type:complete len:639 (-),score=146.72 c39225_g1_i1:92-1855(-)
MGLAVSLFGTRIFRAVQLLFGFVALFNMTFYASADIIHNDTSLWGVCLTLGVVGGAITYKFASVAKASIGLVAGALVAYMGYIIFMHMASAAGSSTTLYVVVGLSALAGGVAGYFIADRLVCVLVSYVGAFAFVFGIDLLTKRQLTFSNVQHGSLDELGWVLVALWGLFGSIGAYVELFGVPKCIKNLFKRKQAPVALQPIATDEDDIVLSKPVQPLSTQQRFWQSKPGILVSSLYVHKVKGRAGLVNLGNTCFTNACLQAVFACPPLRKALARAPNCGGPTTQKLAQIFRQLAAGNSAYVQPPEVRALLQALDFNDGRQHDASEFLRGLVNAMIDEIPKEEINLAKSVFGFQTLGVVKCDVCGHSSEMREDAIDLSLDLCPVLTHSQLASAQTPDAPSVAVSLDSLLERYFTPMRLDGKDRYQCDNCAALTPATRSTHLTCLPETLMITLNRFRYCKNEQIRKKLFNQVLVSDVIVFGEQTYDLTAVVVHKGSSAEGGHYIAYTRLPTVAPAVAAGSRVSDFEETPPTKPSPRAHEWYMMDDKNVVPSTMDRVRVLCETPSCDNAYVLLYSSRCGIDLVCEMEPLL